MPVCLRHGTVFLVKNNDPGTFRLVTAKEHLAAMGFHMFPGQSNSFGVSRMAQLFEDCCLTSQQTKKLLGNGMHLVTQAAWMLYVLGNTARVSSCDMRGMEFSNDSQWE